MTVAELTAALSALPGDKDLLTVSIKCVENDEVGVADVVRSLNATAEIRCDSLLAAVVLVEVDEAGTKKKRPKVITH